MKLSPEGEALAVQYLRGEFNVRELWAKLSEADRVSIRSETSRKDDETCVRHLHASMLRSKELLGGLLCQ